MKEGMILAAGFGTRLKPLTDTLPKALAPINGRPLLDIVICKFIAAGISKIIINTHYLSDKIVEFLADKNYSAEIVVSHEDEILGTGGGIKKIKELITGDDFLVHNVDVVSGVDLTDLINYHQQRKPLVTMVMQNRHTYNQVLVDTQNQICGLDYIKKGVRKLVRQPAGELAVLAFCGVHIINRRIFDCFGDEKFFSIVDTYLESIAKGEAINAYKLPDGVYWKDVGTLEHLAEAGRDEKLWS